MGEIIATYQQVQSVEKQVVQQDSLSLSKSLRTPIQPIVVKEPKHLQQRKYIPTPKIEYRYWSAQDSVYFNLRKDNGKAFINNAVYSRSHEDMEVLEESQFSDSVSQVEAIIEKPKFEISIPPPPVSVRKISPFDGAKDWMAGVIVLMLIIAGFIKLSAGKYLSDLFSSIRYQQSATKLFSSGNVQNQKPGWALTVLFFLSTSLLVFEFAHIGGKTPERINPFMFYVLVNIGVIAYFFAKNILYQFVGYVFDVQSATKEYLFNANMLSKVFGIACLPVVCVVPFVDSLTAIFVVKAGLALFLIMYVIQLLRGAKIILHSPLSIFYMFLYFCALEILPLSILIKVMIY
ncbi:DUF4271 domain-containing protein [Carboxylicivirga sp. M1479]|uniref:DUF4271 domain-containing protein n=1 Tax=Carboxylicivirga sp. M1479 TaxID=2594476 RepID=UPI001177AFD8|nr:DUF4271 domain-containing protein [Carboxylicivirga sp. M1479]TRX72431.1 DUF4271 domain-containing protein [Carboxylicivirga sp. M1479]